MWNGQHYFNKGDTVEVVFREDDDNDDDRRTKSTSYFAAIVLRSPAKTKNQVYVEYHNVVVSDAHGSSRPLREHVDESRVRPPPPETDRSFNLRENVDAFYGNGWRRGSVVGLLVNSKYSVLFDGTDEQNEFERCDLRIHRDWNDGFWTPPLEEQRNSSELETRPREVKLRIKYGGRTSEAKFSNGKMVEVRSDEEGFQGSWYTAVIVDSIGNDKFLVQYQTLRTDDHNELLKLNLDASYIRPCPPEIPHTGYFEQFQEVDAWYNDGWWVGHIFKVFNDYKYIVHFESTNDEMTVEHSKLRPHQEWIDGKWIAASRGSSKLELQSKDREVKFKIKHCGRMSEVKFSKGMMVEVKSDEEGYQGSWYTAVIVGSMGKDKYLVEYQTLKSEDETELLKEKADALYIRPCPPDMQRLDRFKLLEKVDAWYNDGWWVGLISRVLDGLIYSIYFWTSNEELEFNHHNLRPHQEWIGGEFVADFLKKSSELPLKPRTGKLKRQNGLLSMEANYFTKGMKVEVRSDEEGYSNTWYPGIIIGSKGPGKYLVEYLTLRRDNEGKILKEVADAFCIRPSPPVLQPSDPFEPFKEVDAWYNNAWWVGGVCKILQNQGSVYAVYIRSTNEVLEFQHSDLRPHQNWIDGNWVIPCRGRAFG